MVCSATASFRMRKECERNVSFNAQTVGGASFRSAKRALFPPAVAKTFYLDMIGVIFLISHGLLFFLTLHKIVRNTIITNVTCKHSFSPQKTFQLQGQRLMNESQGQRFCLFSAFSFIICLCVHVYRNYMESEFETAAGQVTEKCLH